MPHHKRSEQQKPGPNIVRSWFDNVFRDLLHGLSAKSLALERRRWGWRFRPPRLEYVAYARDYLTAEAVDVFEQFLSFHPDVHRLVAAHDEAVHRLFDACQSFHEALTRSAELRDLYTRIAKECRQTLGDDISSFFGAYHSEQDFLGLLAEYITNHFGELPSYYATSRLWNHYLADFDELRTVPHLAKYDLAVQQAASALTKANKTLDAALRKVRSELSLESDVPFVAEVSHAV